MAKRGRPRRVQPVRNSPIHDSCMGKRRRVAIEAQCPLGQDKSLPGRRNRLTSGPTAQMRCRSTGSKQLVRMNRFRNGKGASQKDELEWQEVRKG
ncbi:hypothetical protein Dimus_000094, partial [Dionaea muscipula]